MLGTIVWLAGSYGFYRYMMGQCRKAAREGTAPKSATSRPSGRTERNTGTGPRTTRKGVSAMADYQIRWVQGHVEVYDRLGRFQFSADTEQEALRDLEDGWAA